MLVDTSRKALSLICIPQWIMLDLLNFVEGEVITIPSSCDKKLNTHRASYGIIIMQASFYLFYVL